MTTLIETIMPTEGYVTSLLEEALNGKSEQEFVAFYLQGVIDRVIREPRTYRCFGPWWPAIKTLIIAGGCTKLGQIVESDVAETYKMSRPALTVIAAHLYSDERVDRDGLFNSIHQLVVLPTSDDTEPYIYTSYDESIEKYKGLGGV
jgi:hypothetical protein